MDGPLYDSCVPLAVQDLICQGLWGRKTGRLLSNSAYFNYYSEQCVAVYHAFVGRIPLSTHEDVVEIARQILGDLPRSTIQQNLNDKHSTLSAENQNHIELLNGSIDLVVRLLFMLDVGQFPRSHTGRAPLRWTEGCISEFLGTIFSQQTTLTHEGVKLDTQFTARNLDLIAGLEVELTTNLADHLILREEDNKVLIFHHASFLRNQQRWVPIIKTGNEQVY